MAKLTLFPHRDGTKTLRIEAENAKDKEILAGFSQVIEFGPGSIKLAGESLNDSWTFLDFDGLGRKL
jgi:hypothetical protein